jgi:5-methyltetrahydrofolate--homocysteine methyltransferase
MLMNHDPNGGAWIEFSKVLEATKEGATFADAAKASMAAGGGRGGRRGGRRRG